MAAAMIATLGGLRGERYLDTAAAGLDDTAPTHRLTIENRDGARRNLIIWSPQTNTYNAWIARVGDGPTFTLSTATAEAAMDERKG